MSWLVGKAPQIALIAVTLTAIHLWQHREKKDPGEFSWVFLFV